jgi:hypothetical protein
MTNATLGVALRILGELKRRADLLEEAITVFRDVHPVALQERNDQLSELVQDHLALAEAALIDLRGGSN